MTSKKWPRFMLFPFALLLCLVILATAFIGLQNASGNGTLYISDIKGDRSVLDDVVISGVLQDRYHGIRFEIRNDAVKRKFLYYDSNEAFALEMSQPMLGNVLIEDGIQYSYNLDYVFSPYANVKESYQKGIDEYGQNYEEKIRTADMVDVYVAMSAMSYEGKNIKWDRIRFCPGAYLKSDTQAYKITEKAYYNDAGSMISHESAEVLPERQARINSSNHAFVLLDGRIYFTLLSASDVKGTNGIYEIEEFTMSWLAEVDDKAQYGKIRTITTFSLDQHNITVLGLKAVNSQLVLILLEDGMLKLRSFDPVNGSMIDELEVAPLSEAELAGELHTFIQDDRLNISIPVKPTQDSESSEASTLLVSTQIGNEIRLLHIVESLDLEKDETLPYTVDEMYEVNGKLFVSAYVLKDKEKRQYPYQDLEPKHYLMFVYQGEKLLYKGELMNDSDEDYIANRQRVQAFSDGYGYSDYQYRQIRDLKVRGR